MLAGWFWFNVALLLYLRHPTPDGVFITYYNRLRECGQFPKTTENHLAYILLVILTIIESF